MRIIILFLFILGCSGEKKRSPSSEELKAPCICTMDYTPVCGSNGKTYSNACEARCQGIDSFKPGECKKPCACTREYAPVCGSDKVTYSNKCNAKCAGVKSKPGPCQ